MEFCFVPQINYGIMDEGDDLGTPSSSSTADSTNSNEFSCSELTEDATSPAAAAAASSSSPASQEPRSLHQVAAPYEMSSLMERLPVKRGLSKHFQGKSRSFTSLSNVRFVEDLAKPDRPYRKKLKPCKSYATGLDTHKPHSIPIKDHIKEAIPKRRLAVSRRQEGWLPRQQVSRPAASTQIRRFFDSSDPSFCLNEG